jgi:serine/threonine protein kinase
MIADFGLARSIEQQHNNKKREYTNCVVTRWYRPPEILLGNRRYDTAVDMWGVGCVIAEMFKGGPILTGSTDVNQCELIFRLVKLFSLFTLDVIQSLNSTRAVCALTPSSKTIVGFVVALRQNLCLAGKLFQAVKVCAHGLANPGEYGKSTSAYPQNLQTFLIICLYSITRDA